MTQNQSLFFQKFAITPADLERYLGEALAETLDELSETPGEELRRSRRAKFRGMGVFA